MEPGVTAAPVGIELTACSVAPLRSPLSRPEAEERARLLKSVADATRLQLLALIASSPTGEACVCDLTEPLGLSQPTVSHHLRILTEAGLITREARGTWAWFSIVPDRFDQISSLL